MVVDISEIPAHAIQITYQTSQGSIIADGYNFSGRGVMEKVFNDGEARRLDRMYMPGELVRFAREYKAGEQEEKVTILAVPHIDVDFSKLSDEMRASLEGMLIETPLDSLPPQFAQA